MSAKKAESRDEKTPGMAQRLRQARINAGFKTATLAVNKFNWAASKYRAHENGQNPFKVADAETYGEPLKPTVNHPGFVGGPNS